MPAGCIVLNLALASGIFEEILLQVQNTVMHGNLAVGYSGCAGKLYQKSWNKQEFILAAKNGRFFIL